MPFTVWLIMKALDWEMLDIRLDCSVVQKNMINKNILLFVNMTLHFLTHLLHDGGVWTLRETENRTEQKT